MGNSFYFDEYLRSKDVGIYRLIIKKYGKFTEGFMILLDLHRPSTLEKSSYSNDPTGEKEHFRNRNFIQVLFVSVGAMHRKSQEEAKVFATQLLGNKENVDWNIDFIVMSKKKFRIKFKKNSYPRKLFLYAQKYANKFGLEVDLIRMPESSSHLLQG